MAIKKSLVESEAEGRERSLRFPDVKYCVLDKKGSHALCLSVEFIIREYIAFRGYHLVCYYLNGERRV